MKRYIILLTYIIVSLSVFFFLPINDAHFAQMEWKLLFSQMLAFSFSVLALSVSLIAESEINKKKNAV